MYGSYGNQIKHENGQNILTIPAPQDHLGSLFPWGSEGPPLGSGDTSEVKQSPSFKQMRCCLFLKGLERRKFHKLPRLHIPVSIKPHCLKIFPFLLSKSLVQPLKPLASCLVPKGAQLCSSHTALPAPDSPETLHAAALRVPISLCSPAFCLLCYLFRGFLPNSLLLLCVHFKYTLKAIFLINEKKIIHYFYGIETTYLLFPLSPVLLYTHTCVIGGTSCPLFYSTYHKF